MSAPSSRSTDKPPIYNIVFDIDGVLCAKNADPANALLFLRKGQILTALKTHYIFPGVIELLTRLYRTENVRVSFFSSGIRQRNELLIPQLLQKALPETHERIRFETTILSREDLTELSREKSYPKSPFSLGNKQKDIEKVLRPGELLENTLLIEDDSSYAMPEQYKNLLHVPETESDHFFEEDPDEDFYPQANRIYYLAGILFTALEQARRDNLPLAASLYSIQFSNDKPIRWELQKNDHFYKIGLSKLQEIDPSLQFHSPHLCKTLSPATESEKQFLDQAIENQDSDGCIVM
ncbi:MAG TPA: hypothetical protein VLE89_05085 [Chlamydiales bacterium]|nr:hypothetical protein [Chlamydiales bacterium]